MVICYYYPRLYIIRGVGVVWDIHRIVGVKYSEGISLKQLERLKEFLQREDLFVKFELTYGLTWLDVIYDINNGHPIIALLSWSHKGHLIRHAAVITGIF